MEKKDKKVVTLYVQDTELFKKLIKESSQLYYEVYHEYPSQAEMILKSLVINNKVLSNNSKISNNKSLSEIFGRV